MRALLVILALFNAANGFSMLIAPVHWYGAVPGVTETGPVNVHFIRDIGLGFLAAAAALALAARRGAPTLDRDPGQAVLLVPACVFLVGHAGLHVVEMAVHGAALGVALRDVALIVVPAVLPLLPLLAWRRRGRGVRAMAAAGPGPSPDARDA